MLKMVAPQGSPMLPIPAIPPSHCAHLGVFHDGTKKSFATQHVMFSMTESRFRTTWPQPPLERCRTNFANVWVGEKPDLEFRSPLWMFDFWRKTHGKTISSPTICRWTKQNIPIYWIDGLNSNRALIYQLWVVWPSYQNWPLGFGAKNNGTSRNPMDGDTPTSCIFRVNILINHDKEKGFLDPNVARIVLMLRFNQPNFGDLWQKNPSTLKISEVNYHLVI